ncbi:MAG: epoxyqueuosine reductase QueH [Treponema sp.]|nr:epoxyqueuosine reductase QueH [Treponema sp.]
MEIRIADKIVLMKLLLHTCCAPCSVACIAALREEGIEPVLFWYNPNIHPSREYASRRDTLVRYAGDLGLDLVMEDEYGLRPFIAGLCRGMCGLSPARSSGPARKPGGPELFGKEGGNRCAYCYRIRLAGTAALARERGFDAFSTTLLISPYQNHELLAQTAREAGGSLFLYRDFRPRFRQGQAEARRLGLYMQKYCGCIFSEEERYA